MLWIPSTQIPEYYQMEGGRWILGKLGPSISGPSSQTRQIGPQKNWHPVLYIYIFVLNEGRTDTVQLIYIPQLMAHYIQYQYINSTDIIPQFIYLYWMYAANNCMQYLYISEFVYLYFCICALNTWESNFWHPWTNNLPDKNIRGLIFHGPNLPGPDLLGPNLPGTNLPWPNLPGPNLTGVFKSRNSSNSGVELSSICATN